MRRKSTSNAFTLVELLVVIAIISVLAALLLPALEETIITARRVTCANNQKQLYLSMTLYADTWDGAVAKNDYGLAGTAENPQSYSGFPHNICFRDSVAPRAITHHGAWLVNEVADPAVYYCADATYDEKVWDTHNTAEFKVLLQTKWREWFVTEGTSGTAPLNTDIPIVLTAGYSMNMRFIDNMSYWFAPFKDNHPAPYKALKLRDLDSKMPFLCDTRTVMHIRYSAHRGQGFNVTFGDGSVTFMNSESLIKTGIEKNVNTGVASWAGYTRTPDDPWNDPDYSSVTWASMMSGCHGTGQSRYGSLWKSFWYLRNE